MSWGPILDGEAAERARKVVWDIAEAATTRAKIEDVALTWAYIASATEDPTANERYEAALDQLVKRFEAGFGSHALYGGVAGAGWLVAHVAEDANELLEIVDRVLLDAMRVDKWTHDYDLIGGLVGFGVYFLERGEAGREGLQVVLEHLERNAVHKGDGLTWFTAPELLPDHQRVGAPNGYYNCGLAHGMPAVIVLLARVIERDPSPRWIAMRDAAVRWLVAQQLPGRTYPTTLHAEAQPRPGRTAWCYGDPGVHVALWRAQPSPQLLEDALAALSRDAKTAVVNDAEMCHGAMGLAHLANRWFHATGDERFRNVARNWIEHGLAFRQPNVGVGGFRSYFPGIAGSPERWDENPSFLDGALGIALTLLAATSMVEPEWDRLMMCDLPVRE